MIGRPISLAGRRQRSVVQLLVRVGPVHPLRGGVRLLLQLPGPDLLGLRRQPVRAVGQLPAAHAGARRTAVARDRSQVLKVDILQTHETTPHLESIGHNALAGWTYLLTFLAFLFQSLTGFGMYAAMSEAWLPQPVRLDRPAHGRRLRRPPVAPPDDVVLHHLHDGPRLPRLLPRLRRGPRGHLVDGRRWKFVDAKCHVARREQGPA